MCVCVSGCVGVLHAHGYELKDRKKERKELAGRKFMGSYNRKNACYSAPTCEYELVIKYLWVCVCLTHIFLDGYCSIVQGLLDWFEVDLGFTELLFIQIDLCVLCVLHTHGNMETWKHGNTSRGGCGLIFKR